MIVTFTIPNKYIDRISAAFKVETVEEFKGKIIDVVRDTVKLHEEEKAVKEATENIPEMPEDLILPESTPP
ncbi:MAG: hypothetical protein FVQ85_02955 [Planctomycetes bacterium]|nr:hypothetical protein [Planctomycetota bacterium]